jgi:hypothetical protein
MDRHPRKMTTQARREAIAEMLALGISRHLQDVRRAQLEADGEADCPQSGAVIEVGLDPSGNPRLSVSHRERGYPEGDTQ